MSDTTIKSAESEPTKIRLLTYLFPGLPYGLFQTYQCYLEEVLDCRGYLSVESRWSSPPAGRVDPFTDNAADVVFMCSTGYVRLLDEHNAFMELLPVAPVYDDPRTDAKPLYYSDVIIRSDKASQCKEFADLRGHRWAVNDTASLSGYSSMLNELRSMGVNASFFGNIVQSGSHLESINLVLNNVVDAAAIDSNNLQYWLQDHPRQKDELHVLCSWGPWPIQPIVINSRLSVETKQKITEALLNALDHPEFGKQFKKYGVTGFKHVDSTFYDSVRETLELSNQEKLYPAYY